MSACLYRTYDAQDNLLYVGISLHAFYRLAQHSAYSDWFKDVARITLQKCESRAQALEQERAAIKAEHPKFNRIHTLPLRLPRLPRLPRPPRASLRTERMPSEREARRAAVWKEIQEGDGLSDDEVEKMQAFFRDLGRIGGKKSASLLTPEQRTERARKAAIAPRKNGKAAA